MSFLASHWWLFLIAFIGFSAVAIINQIKRMKAIWSGKVFDSGGESFFKGLGLMMICGLIGGVNFFLFVIGVIANLMGR
jgi:hypothetical protein